jgi:hypothetical protein
MVALGGAALSAPVALNAGFLVLHKAQPTEAASGPGLQSDLEFAELTAWGPFGPRIAAARALAAQIRGDLESERAALNVVVAADPWDTSKLLRLADLQLARGDTDGAVDAWRTGRLVVVPLNRGTQLPPHAALPWLGLAQRVDPNDWRPYARAAAKLADDLQFDRAGLLLAEALGCRGTHPARQAVMARLRDPAAPLMDELKASVSSVDAELFQQASVLLERRSDIRGAVYAARLAAQADPSSFAMCGRARELGISLTC